MGHKLYEISQKNINPLQSRGEFSLTTSVIKNLYFMTVPNNLQPTVCYQKIVTIHYQQNHQITIT